LRWGTIHGHFKVADTIAVDEYYTRAEWEAALRVAKYEAMEGEWPSSESRELGIDGVGSWADNVRASRRRDAKHVRTLKARRSWRAFSLRLRLTNYPALQCFERN
jgi:hypothetical protein